MVVAILSPMQPHAAELGGDGARSLLRFASKAVILIALIGVTGVWTIALGAKIASMDEFLASVEASRVVPTVVVLPVSIGVLALEALAAVTVVFPRTRALGLALSFMLSWLYLAYALWRMIMHIDAPCNCFGSLFKTNPPEAAALSLTLAALSAYVLTICDLRGKEKAVS